MAIATSLGREAIVVVVVLYHPDQEALDHIENLARDGFSVLAISNGITATQAETLTEFAGVTLVDNLTNIGLARALNQGIGRFLAGNAPFVLLLDQDSRLTPDKISSLGQRASVLSAQGVRLGCLAPRLVDRKSPDAKVGAAGEPVTVATSGSLLTRQALLATGMMWEQLFIDGIDHEWCFRARMAGYQIVVADDIVLTHDMGDDGVRVGGRYRPIHRSPARHYHILRNTLWLQRCRYIPLRWRLLELAKGLYRAPVYLGVSNDRLATLRAIGRAIIDGTASPPGLPRVTV